MITTTIQPISPAFRQKFHNSRERIIDALLREMRIQTGILKRYIKEQKLSGQVLKNRTGNLRNAVFNRVESDSNSVTGHVFVDKTAPYGAYQEYGASIPERVPRKAKALHWIGADGRDVFAKRARAFQLKARPFMGPSLEEKRDDIVNALRRAVAKTLAAE